MGTVLGLLWMTNAIAGVGWTVAPLEPSMGVRLGAGGPVQLDVLAGPHLRFQRDRIVNDLSSQETVTDLRLLNVGGHAEVRVRGLFHEGAARLGWVGAFRGTITEAVALAEGPSTPSGTRELLAWTGPSLSVRLSDRWQIGGDVGLVRASQWRSAYTGFLPGSIPFSQSRNVWTVSIAPTPHLWLTFAGKPTPAR